MSTRIQKIKAEKEKQKKQSQREIDEKRLEQFKSTVRKMRCWSANSLFFEKLLTLDKTIIWTHDMGLTTARIVGYKVVKRRVPELVLEVPFELKRNDVIERFLKYGYDKYSVKL